MQLQPYAKQQLQGCGARYGVFGGCQGVGEKCGSYRLLLWAHTCLQQQISAAFDCISFIQLCGCSSWTAAAVKGINSSTTLLCHRSSAQAACQLCTRPLDGVACQAAPALLATQLTPYEKANCACGCVVLKQQPACDLCHSSSCWHDTTACGSVEASCTSLLVRPCSYCFVLVRVRGVMVCCVLRSLCAVQPRHLPGLSAVRHAVPGVGLLLRLASCQQPTCKSPSQPTSCTSRSLQVLWPTWAHPALPPLLLFVMCPACCCLLRQFGCPCRARSIGQQLPLLLLPFLGQQCCSSRHANGLGSCSDPVCLHALGWHLCLSCHKQRHGSLDRACRLCKNLPPSPVYRHQLSFTAPPSFLTQHSAWAGARHTCRWLPRALKAPRAPPRVWVVHARVQSVLLPQCDAIACVMQFAPHVAGLPIHALSLHRGWCRCLVLVMSTGASHGKSVAGMQGRGPQTRPLHALFRSVLTSVFCRAERP